MTKFTLTKRAMADLVDIGQYTQERLGREQRNHYLPMLDSCFQQLAENPARGRGCSDIPERTFQFAKRNLKVYMAMDAKPGVPRRIAARIAPFQIRWEAA